METRWYFQAPDGSTGGPIPTAEVLKSLLDGSLPLEVQLCEEGKATWSSPRELQAFRLACRVVRASLKDHVPAPGTSPRPAQQAAPPPRAAAPMQPRRAPAPMPPPRAVAAPMPPPRPAPAPAFGSLDDDDEDMRTVVATAAAGEAVRNVPGAPGPRPVATVPGLPAPTAPTPQAVAPPQAAQSAPLGPSFDDDDDDDEELKTRVATSPETDPDLPYPFQPRAAPAPAPARAPAPTPPRAPVRTMMGMPGPAIPPAPKQPHPAPIADEVEEDDLKTRVADSLEADEPMVFRPPVPHSPVPHSPVVHRDSDDPREGQKARGADEQGVPKVVVAPMPEPAPRGTVPSFDGGLDAPSQRAWPPQMTNLQPPAPSVSYEPASDGSDPGARITAPPQERRMRAMMPTMKLAPIQRGPSKLILALVAAGAALAAFLVALAISWFLRR